MSSCGTTVAAATRPTAVGSRSRADPRLLSAARGAHRRRSGPGPGPGQRHRHPRVLRPLAAGLPPFQSSVEDERDMFELINMQHDDSWVTYKPPPPPPPPPPEPEAPAYGTSPDNYGTKVTSAKSAKAIDLFERAATPIGTVERAEAALAASRAMQTKGIIKVNPGSTVKREKPTARSSDEDVKEAVQAVNFAKSFAERRAAEEASRRSTDPTARLQQITEGMREDNLARERLAARTREEASRRMQRSSSYYGGSGYSTPGVESTQSSTSGGYGADLAAGGLAGGSGDAKRLGPASDFWEWSPPSMPAAGPAGAASSYYPAEMQRQKAPAYTRRVEAAVEVMERAPEQTLDLQFETTIEQQNATLPQFQSQVKPASSPPKVEPAKPASASPLGLQDAQLQQLREVYQTSTVSDAAILAAEQRYDVDVSAPAPAGLAGSSVEASLEDALASPVRELGVEDGAKEGTLSSGARWWREEGKEYLEDGKVMSWTVIRGTSADGSVEWEEKFWETSDPFTYRELGAVKSGRDSNGQAWQESWKELYNHDANQLPFIHREASKWSHTPKGKCWSEGWTEDYRADGVVDRYCEKTGSLEDGAAPEDGHANRWTQKWGEKWDGQGGCIKWTDTWASRDHAEGGMANAPSRSWGEKWEEKWGDNYNENGRAGLRQGLAWDELGGNHKERTWGEEHYPDGRLHKYGNSNDGSQYWDEWCDGAGGWWETAPSFGWHEAIGHSPSLMNVRLQPRAVMGKGKNGRNIITPHRSKKGNTAPGASPTSGAYNPNAYRGSENNPYRQTRPDYNGGSQNGYNGGSQNGYNGGSQNGYNGSSHPTNSDGNGSGGSRPPGGYDPNDPNGGGGVY